MGAGLPLAATTASRELAETFRRTGYFNTFASSPLQGAVGKAVIDIIEEEGLQQNVATVRRAPDRGAEANTAPLFGDG